MVLEEAIKSCGDDQRDSERQQGLKVNTLLSFWGNWEGAVGESPQPTVRTKNKHPRARLVNASQKAQLGLWEP